MYETRRKMTKQEYSDFLTVCFGEINFGVNAGPFKAGEVFRKMDHKRFMASLNEEGYLWECGVCHGDFEFREDAADCCDRDVTPKT